ncbi:hypothetical protein [Rhodopseudomonas sp. AAP120]|uniref:hypothetical protein n=1 Tax=Rhodopseudomonas sp. AAP120 TaxID=1523430 RepID=UPI0006B950E3|nr:hypothetical protein [Rhodopseudomonas sp. AAP120]
MANGIAMLDCVEATASSRITLSKTTATASDAATARISRSEPKGFERGTNPASGPGDRVMTKSSQAPANHRANEIFL